MSEAASAPPTDSRPKRLSIWWDWTARSLAITWGTLLVLWAIGLWVGRLTRPEDFTPGREGITGALREMVLLYVLTAVAVLPGFSVFALVNALLPAEGPMWKRRLVCALVTPAIPLVFWFPAGIVWRAFAAVLTLALVLVLDPPPRYIRT